MSENQRSRLATHLLRIGAYVSGFFWLGLVYFGWILVSTPESGKHSRLTGWIVLTIAVAVAIATMNHWVKYLQIILGGFILGLLLALGSGHLLNGQPFPRAVAAGLIVLLVGCSLIAGTLAERKLKMFDRVALVAFLAAFVGGLFKGPPTAGLIGLGMGFACLLALWVHNRNSSGRDKKEKPNQVPNGAAVPPPGGADAN